ncbi:CdiA family toxin C-terminal domain-containing protein, partial [Paenibacillus septentrionalis]
KPDLTPPNAPKVDQIPDQKTKIEGPVNTVPVIKNNFEYIDSFADHMINAQGIVRKGNKGVVGGHNLESFEKILTDQGWKLDDVIVSRTPHPTVTGVYEIEYRLPAIDRELKVIPGQYKNIPQPKTVYDSNLISNEQMIVWGKEAMENGVINGRLVTGYSSNGLRFTGYLDDSGNITNFHPSFEGK